MANNVNYEKNIVNCCPGMKYGNLKKWTTKKILKSQYRLSSISIYLYKKYTPYVDKVLSTIWPGEGITTSVIEYYMPILDLMFATSIIRAWKTIPKNIQKDKTVRDAKQRKRNIQSLYCSQANYFSSSCPGNSRRG